jgi:predicted lipid-binding transport protein (Tim44 family)
MVHFAGEVYSLFNFGGTIGVSGMLLILLTSAIRHTVELYRREPLPQAQQQPETVREKKADQPALSQSLPRVSSARS